MSEAEISFFDQEFEKFSYEERLEFCCAVANLIGADKVVSEDEKLYLAALIRQTGLSLFDEKVKQAIDKELESPSLLENLVINLKSVELRRVLYRVLIEVAFCDGSLSNTEEERLIEFAAKFDLNTDAAKNLVKWTQDSLALEEREQEIMSRL